MPARTVSILLIPDEVTGSLRLANEPAGTRVEMWRGNAHTFRALALDTDGSLYDISDTSSLTLYIRANQEEGSDILATETVNSAAYGSPTSRSDFDSGNDEHASFAFTDSEMNFSLGTATERRVWFVVIAALNAGGTRTLGGGHAFFIEDNDAAGSPDENLGTAITQDQADARYVQYEGNDANSNVEDSNLTIDGGLIS